MAKRYRPSSALYRQGLALALTIASWACHDDRTLGEVVDSKPAALCGGAPCAGWCERPPGACDAPTIRGICRPSLGLQERNTMLTMCLRNMNLTTADRVCGCNGRSFRAECERAIYEVSLFRAGECSAAACMDTTDCAAGHFCEFPAGRCGGEGTCQPGGPGAMAVRCTPDAPAVCGCDGNTYLSDCARRQAGVSEGRAGSCPR